MGEAGRVRLPVAVLAVLGSVVVALLVVALVVRVDTDRLPTGPPRDPPPAPPAATTMTVDGLRVGFEEFRATLPGPPFVCRTEGLGAAAFTPAASCGVVVHPDYDDKGSDWAAVTGVGLVDASLVDADLERTTSAVFGAVVSSSFAAADHPKVTRPLSETVQVPGASAAWTRQADVEVRSRGLKTPYDRLVVVVVRLESGRHVAFYSDFPHDGSKRALHSVVESADSLSARR